MISYGIDYLSNNEHKFENGQSKRKSPQTQECVCEGRVAFSFSGGWVLHGKPCVSEDFLFFHFEILQKLWEGRSGRITEYMCLF